MIPLTLTSQCIRVLEEKMVEDIQQNVDNKYTKKRPNSTQSTKNLKNQKLEKKISENIRTLLNAVCRKVLNKNCISGIATRQFNKNIFEIFKFKLSFLFFNQLVIKFLATNSLRCCL